MLVPYRILPHTHLKEGKSLHANSLLFHPISSAARWDSPDF
jgi:hypothetical protein